MLNCKKCGGKVFIDRMFAGSKKKAKGDGNEAHEESTNVELACIMCGKRWMINREKSVLGRWLHRLEKERANAN